MDQHTILLERMASISPGVRVHLGGENWLQHIDADEITPRLLVLECFSVMIDEVYELGIEFYCTREDLCDNLYDLDKTLLLFEVVYPTPLYRSITEDDGFKRWLISTIKDGAGDPNDTTIMNLLNYLAFDHPVSGDVFLGTFNFLHDKIKSTQVFDAYILSILNVDNTPFDVPVDTLSVSEYLTHVQDNITRMLRAIDTLNRKFPSVQNTIQLQYNRVDIYKRNAISTDTLQNNVWMYQIQKQTDVPETPMMQVLIVKFTKEFEGITPFYEDYFKLLNQEMTRDDIVSLVVGCFERTVTKDAFTSLVDSATQRLSSLMSKTDAGLHVFIQSVCLCLVQEFYP